VSFNNDRFQTNEFSGKSADRIRGTLAFLAFSLHYSEQSFSDWVDLSPAAQISVNGASEMFPSGNSANHPLVRVSPLMATNQSRVSMK
jgi:hypothetical protein